MSLISRNNSGGFFGRTRTGWTLMKDSFSVIRDYPELMIFPLIAGLSSIVFFVLFFFSFLVVNPGGSSIAYAGLFVLYVLTTFISTYFSAALVFGANQALHGENPDVIACVKAVSDQVGPIFVWSVIAATVSLILRILEETDNPIAGILRALFAVGWSIMTFFIVPVIVFEDVSVKSMFTRSGTVFKETWGETLGSGFGITLVVMGIGIALVMGAVIVSIPLFLVSPGLGVVLAICLVVSALVFTYLLGQTVWVIAKTALYNYAISGQRPAHFDNFDFGTLGGRTASLAPSSTLAGTSDARLPTGDGERGSP